MLESGWRETRKMINGVSLHIVEAGDAGDPVVILIHGFPEFWWAWRHQITPLANAGYHVIVPDMRGYNQSDAPPEISAYTLDTLASDVIALADAYGAERFHVVGHDWGAVIGWWVVAHYPDRIHRAVLMDGPHPGVMRKQALKHPSQALRSIYVAYFQLPWLPEAMLSRNNFAALKSKIKETAKPGAFEEGSLERYAEAWKHPGSLTAMLNYYRALRYKPRSKMSVRVVTPTLILWADDDAFLEHHVAEASLKLCESGQLEFIKDVTHWLHLEKPALINQKIIDWFGS